jgi:uncharacterized protein (TIGR02217 family)
MADFLEERLSELVRFGATWTEGFAVREARSASGAEYRSLIHPFPVREFDVSYLLDRAALWTEVVNVYMRAHGTYAGFRVRCFDEYSTNGAKGVPTAFDQAPLQITLGAAYQMIKVYGVDKSAGASGYPYRIIKKPVAGTSKCAIGTIEIEKTVRTWDVDTTTGILTFPVNGTGSITAITKASQAVITLSAAVTNIFTGQTILITGVSGMTQINNKRALVVNASAYTLTIDLNTTAYSTYTSGGTVNTRPQSGETVTGGCEFDFPVRFTTEIPVEMAYPGYRPVEALKLIELLNP